MSWRVFFLSVFLCQCCFATDVLVTVYCNGRFVPDLAIDVTDAEGQTVAGATSTDSSGQFTIANEESYTAPFYLFFTAYNGSTCGAYSVNIQDITSGNVELAYYPTCLPCSCAHCFGECE